MARRLPPLHHLQLAGKIMGGRCQSLRNLPKITGGYGKTGQSSLLYEARLKVDGENIVSVEWEKGLRMQKKHERKMAEEQKKVEEIEAVKRGFVYNQKEWRQEGGRQYANVAHRPMVAPKVFGPRQPNWNPHQHHQQKPFHQQIAVDKKGWNIYPKNQTKSRVASTDRQKYGPATKKMIPAVEKKKDKVENFLSDFQSKLRLKTAEEVAPLIVFDEPEKKDEAKDELKRYCRQIILESPFRMAEDEMKKEVFFFFYYNRPFSLLKIKD